MNNVKRNKYYFDHIVFLTGQSNAVGYGGFYDPSNIEDEKDPNIFGYNVKLNCWEVFDLQKAFGAKKENYQCMAFHYAKEYLKQHPNSKIGIIICGKANESIIRWVVPYKCVCAKNHLAQSVIFNKTDIGDIYTFSTMMIKNALEHTMNKSIDIIMWHQGESDYMEKNLWYYPRIRKVIRQYLSESFVNKNTYFLCCELLFNGLTNKQNKSLLSLNVDNSSEKVRTLFNRHLPSHDGLHMKRFFQSSFRTFIENIIIEASPFDS